MSRLNGGDPKVSKIMNEQAENIAHLNKIDQLLLNDNLTAEEKIKLLNQRGDIEDKNIDLHRDLQKLMM